MGLEILSAPRIRAIDDTGAPVPLAKLYCYAAGSSSVLQNTYADSGQVTPNANPIVADSAGLFGAIFMLPLAYNFILKSNDGGTTYWSQDNVAGPNYNALLDSTWQLKDNLDLTKILKFQLSSITTATTRTMTVPDASDTLAVLALAQTLVAKTLTACAGLAMTAGRIQGALAGGTAANNLTLGSGNVHTIGGNTQINLIDSTGWQAGSIVTIIFSGTPTVKNQFGSSGANKQMFLSGGDFAATASDTLTLAYDGTNWVELCRSVN